MGAAWVWLSIDECLFLYLVMVALGVSWRSCCFDGSRSFPGFRRVLETTRSRVRPPHYDADPFARARSDFPFDSGVGEISESVRTWEEGALHMASDFEQRGEIKRSGASVFSARAIWFEWRHGYWALRDLPETNQ